MIHRVLRGAILSPAGVDQIDYWPDGAIATDEQHTVVAAGPWPAMQRRLGSAAPIIEQARGIVCPPFLDAHLHIPQHPIRGHFTDGVGDDSPNGRLLEGLLLNVFPAEGRFADRAYAQETIRQFAADTLAHGVVGGSAYATVHADAADDALAMLHPFWHVGLVLMNQNCPPYLRNDASVLPRVEAMARRHGRRCVVTDRFAVTVDSPLRRGASAMAGRLGLRTQTHLNEQRAEKRHVERDLYPQARHYTDVYLQDGLLEHRPILAHCLHMSDEEFALAARKQGAIAHCPVSNTLLGSGVMPLDRVLSHGMDYAICTDVGASPTTSLLVEMSWFVSVHAGRSSRATPSAALYRTTAGPARMLDLAHAVGRFAPGMPLSYIEIAPRQTDFTADSADQLIAEQLLELDDSPDAPAIDLLEREGLQAGKESSALAAAIERRSTRLDEKILSVTLAGQQLWQRSETSD